MIAFQLAAKATRDALFLDSFAVSALPSMVMTAAVVSLVLAFVATRALTSAGPTRLIPIAFASSAALLLVEWALVSSARRAVAVVVYLHFSGLGAVLISGFWSIVNERFDPRTAKRQIGRIVAGGTVGGFLGGLLAERVGDLLSVTAMLPILAAMHFVCAWLVLGIRSDGQERRPAPVGGQDESSSGISIIRRTGYLQAIIALVVLATVAEGMLDYVFKARVQDQFGGGSLLRFFAVFYTGVALLTVVVQATVSRFSLERLGIGRTVAVLPLSVVAGGAAAIMVPRFAAILAARAAESVFRNGPYRAGYELLYAPLAPRQKRATKTLVDVGVVRVGDVVGAGLVQIALMVGLAAAGVLLSVAIAISFAAVVVALGLQRAYVRQLEKSLLSRAGQVDLSGAQEAATRTAMLQSAGGLGWSILAPSATEERISEPRHTPREVRPARSSAPGGLVLDDETSRVVELRSRDVDRVRGTLEEPLTDGLVAYVIPLMAWDDVATDAIGALRKVSARVIGQLVDRLVDPDESFAVRRRIPLVLATCPSPRAVDGLLAGLEDPRFEVRYRCGRALSRLLEQNADLAVDRKRAHAAVMREVAVDKGVWESQRLLDRMDDEDWSPVMDKMLRDRANRSLEHVFTVLSLFLPRKPLQVAFKGLHTDDRYLRGTALEYLESALPEEIRRALWPFLEDTRGQGHERRSANEVLSDLLESNASIVVNLEALRKKRDSAS